MASREWNSERGIQGRACRWMYKGKEYDKYEALVAAMHGSPAPAASGGGQSVDASAQELHRVKAALEDGAGLESCVEKLFSQFAGSDKRLDAQELHGLAESLGAQYHLNAKECFAEFQTVFYRFDFDGSRTLNAHETFQLIKFMLHMYVDKMEPTGSTANVRTANVRSQYNLGTLLGQGGFGKVYLATFRENSQERVVKFFDKSNRQCGLESIAEFKVMLKFDHPKIARTYDVFQDAKYFYVVSEPYKGGDLTTVFKKAQAAGVQITATYVANLWIQALEGIKYLHMNRTMHCDIKENNMMIATPEYTNPTVIVIDFGQAQTFYGGAQYAGTPFYMGPEVWTQGLWTPKGDVFSLGVMFAHMWTFGRDFPFTGRTQKEIMQRICHDRPNLSSIRFPVLEDMLVRMLATEFYSRPTAEQVMHHQFFASNAHLAAPAMDNSLIQVGMEKHNRLYKGMLSYIADTMNLVEMKRLNSLFNALDEDKSGTLTGSEIRSGLLQHGKMSHEDVGRFVEAMVGDDGICRYTEFMATLMVQSQADLQHRLWALYQSLDDNKDGNLSRDELAQVLEHETTKALVGEDAQGLLDEFDMDGDGKVTWDEFFGKLSQRVDHNLMATVATVAVPHLALQAWREGDTAEYYSSSHHSWVRCTILKTKGDLVMISCKKGYWIRKGEQDRILRHPR